MTDLLSQPVEAAPPTSLSVVAARKLATTTKSVPQMRGITPRWLLRMLPWVEVPGGTYRLNQRLASPAKDGLITFVRTGTEFHVIPSEFGELPLLHGFDDLEVLGALAERCEQRDFHPGDVLVESGQPLDTVFILAHGKATKHGVGGYGEPVVLGALADGDFFGDAALADVDGRWPFTVRAETDGTVLLLGRQSFQEVSARSESLRTHVRQRLAAARISRNKKGEVTIELASGHTGEAALPNTFADYESKPREYELSVAQTVLRVHSRVADLYNNPMNQVEQQLRLTIEALRERQEHEIVNNADFGLLHNLDVKQRIQTRTGPPTPGDLDELLSRRRKTQFILAHPKAISAFGRECNHRAIYPQTTEVSGRRVMAWRGVPLLPCDKIHLTDIGTTSILAMRTGEDSGGVIGLHRTGLPGEYQPGVSVRFTGIDDHAVISYLVSIYYSAVVLVPDALGVLEKVQIYQ